MTSHNTSLLAGELLMFGGSGIVVITIIWVISGSNSPAINTIALITGLITMSLGRFVISQDNHA